MPSAIILVSTSIGMEKHVLTNLKCSEGVQEAFWVNGAYDLVVKVKADTFDMLRDTLAQIKKSLPKIQSMVTMLIIEHPQPINTQ